MLIDSVKRLDANSKIKLYNIDSYTRPKRISSVPALLILPEKNIIYGRQVFDHLLLPGRGVLVTGGESQPSASAASTSENREPVGFSTIKARTSSSFAKIDETEAIPLGSHSDSWAWMGADETKPTPKPTTQTTTQSSKQGSPFSIETRDTSARALPDISDIMARREHDLKIV